MVQYGLVFNYPPSKRTGYTFDYWGDSSGNKLEISMGTDGATDSWYYPRYTLIEKADKNITTIKYFPSFTSISPITTKVHYYDGSNWVEVGDKILYIE